MSKKFLNSYRYPRPLPVNIISWPLLHPRDPQLPLTLKQVPRRPREGGLLTHLWKSLGTWIQNVVNECIRILKSLTWLPEIIWGSTPIPAVIDGTIIKVMDLDDMNYIWSSGFYGKGILSRSEPTWLMREKKRIISILERKSSTLNDVDISDELLQDQETFSEEITQTRRLYRDAWKRERDAFLVMEKELKQKSPNGELSNKDLALLNRERDRLSLMKDELHKGPKGINIQAWDSLNKGGSPVPEDDQLQEDDLDVLIDFNNVKNIEYLQLAPYEAIFLLQLGVIYIEEWDLKSLMIHLVDEIGIQFIIEYAVYYHYKSLGWCVKPGLKFSTDLVLYSRGPPFTHAEFAIKIVRDTKDGTIGTNGIENMIDYSAIYRVVAGVKKNLILCYVDGCDDSEIDLAWDIFKSNGDLIELINNFGIAEVGFKRWTPSRTRM